MQQIFEIPRQEFLGECGGHILTKDCDGSLFIDCRTEVGNGIVWVATTDTPLRPTDPSIAVYGMWHGGTCCVVGVIDCNTGKTITELKIESEPMLLCANKQKIIRDCCDNELQAMLSSKKQINIMPDIHTIQVPKEATAAPRICDNCVVFGDGQYDYLAVKIY